MKDFLGFPAYSGSKPYIFVCYSRKDRDAVASIMKVLYQCHYRIWYDAGVYAGDEWDNEIADHILNSSVFLAFHSVNSSQSRHCRAELRTALHADVHIRIISVYLDKVKLDTGIEMYLRGVQAEKLYEYESPVQFAEECLLKLSDLAPCREEEPSANHASFPHAAGPVTWEMGHGGTITIEPLSSPEGEFKLLLSVRSGEPDTQALN